MSDLQIGLTIIGVLVIACVIAYNRMQENRFRRRAEASFGGDRGDALLEPMIRSRQDRIEPQFKPSTDDAADSVAARLGRVEPVVVPAATTPEKTDEIDAPIDYTLQVTSSQMLERSALEQLLDALDGLGRRAHVQASLADGIWVPLANAPAGVNQVRVAMQLADRRGQVTADDLQAFAGLVTQWGESVGATVAAPDMAPYLQAARDLDRFCADVDVVVGLNVVAASGEPFSGAKVRSRAEAAGFRLENGVFRLEDAQGAGLFSLENQQGEPFDADRLKTATIAGVTLLLDVPRLEQGVKVFDQMIDTGRQLAVALGGSLVDDNRVPVTEAGLEQIRAQLRHIYAAMEARGIRAGSRVALRLFS